MSSMKSAKSLSLNSKPSNQSLGDELEHGDGRPQQAREVSEADVNITFPTTPDNKALDDDQPPSKLPEKLQIPGLELRVAILPKTPMEAKSAENDLQRRAVLAKSPSQRLMLVENEMAVSPSARMLSSVSHDENAYACGMNVEGQLGVGHGPDYLGPEPRQLVGPLRWVALAQGDNHAAGLDDQGHLFSWGRCRAGTEPEAQSDGPIPKPLNFSLSKDEKVIGLDCGGGHSVALTDKHVYAWGEALEGQCATPPEEATCIPMPREIPSLTGMFVTQVACGRSHTLCVTATSHVYAWGANGYGQLGIGNTKSSATPCLVEGLWAMPVRQLAAGDTHSAALLFNGSLFTWGSNASGQLGLPASGKSKAGRESKPSRKLANALSGSSQMMINTLMDMGVSKSRAELALRETGHSGVEVAAEWLFANNVESEEEEQGSPKELGNEANGLKYNQDNSSDGGDDAGPGVKMLEMSEVRKGKMVSNGYVPLNNHGAVIGKGKAPLIPLESVHTKPCRVALQGVSSIACGGDFCVALLETGAFAWGNGLLGQLGTGKQQICEKPTRVEMPLDASAPASVACGRSHSLFLSCEGRVYGCGDNSSAQLGIDTGGTPVLELTEVPFPPGMRKGSNSVIRVCAGAQTSGFLLGAVSDILAEPKATLRDHLQLALDEVLVPPEKRGKAKVHEETSSGLQSHLALFQLLNTIKLVFSSAAAMNAVFGISSQVGIDVVFLEEVQSKLLGMGSDLVNAALYKSTLYLLDDTYKKMHLLGTADRVQILVAASMNVLLSQPKFAAHLLPRLCTVILSASSRHTTCRQLLQKWWADFPSRILLQRVVQPLQAYLTSELMKLKKLTVNVMNCIKLLDEVFKANLTGRNLDAEDFHNELISEKLDVLDHYIAWRQSRETPSMGPNADGPFSFCSYPFLLNNKAKSKLLHTEAKIRMETTVAQARLENNNRRSTSSRNPEDRVLPAGKTRVPMMSPERPQRRSTQTTSRLSIGGAGPSGHSHSLGVRGLLGSLFGSEGTSSAGQDSMSSPGAHLRSPGRIHSRSGSAMDATRRQMASEIHRTTSFRTQTIARQNSMLLPPPDRCGVPAQHNDHCILRVRRTYILEDALEEIARQRTKDLLKPLRVHFIGEEGIDAGGVRKEFFQLLVNDLLRQDYGMLEYFEETRVFWFNPNTLEVEDEFMLIGIIMGLAIYNGVLLDLPLPQVLYKKLLKQEVGLRDLEEMQPLVGRSMKQLLQYEGPGSVEDIFCQTFSIDYTAFGKVTSVELKPGGDDIYVTEENRREFVELYVDHVLNLSVQPQFDAFSKGFLMVCGGPALSLFHAQELETLVCGEGRLDFTALRKNAKYDGGYNAESEVVTWLWEVLLEFDEEEKQLFLKFFTGSDRAPIGGLGSMRSVIQRDGTDSLKLPTSHTCFNTLLLPDYSSKELLQDRLKLAILNAEGFGLE